MSKSVLDGKRNEYDPNFVKDLGALASHAIGDGGTPLVSARSYGNSQALDVLRSHADSSRVLFTGLCPAPGAFGNKWSANVENVKVYTIPSADHDNADYLANGALDRMKECVKHFKFQDEAAGDVVYGRPVGKWGASSLILARAFSPVSRQRGRAARPRPCGTSCRRRRAGWGG